MRHIVICILLTFSYSLNSNARSEYALNEKLNCSACHVTAWGAGPRTTYGKVYGSHGNKMSKLSESDVYYADLRMIGYRPTHPSKTVNGFALMTAAPSANVRVYEGARSSEVRLVYTFNSSPLGGTYAREAYVAWQPEQPEAEAGNTPARLVLGRFNFPFGLLTDEHRAYTRIQSRTPLENYEMGAAISVNIVSDFHFDFALVNDLESGGSFSNQNVTFGSILNARFNPSQIPIFIGSSGMYGYVLNTPKPYALSYYAGISLDQMTRSKVSGSLLFERVDSWNQPADRSGSIHPNVNTFFGLNLSGVGSHSVGYYSQAKWELNSRWVLFYRFDYYKQDTQISNNSFARHGLGFETYLPGNLIFNFRGEKAALGNTPAGPNEPLAAQNDVLAMIRCWI